MDNQTLRKLQLTELEVLKEIKRVCEKNDIKYSLAFGTMLGAVRHKGFIPWDDDMDIIMTYENYLKFMEIAKTDLDPKYSFVEWGSSKYYPHPFGKVVKNGTKYHEQSYSKKAAYGIFVDVFYILPFPDSTSDRNEMIKKSIYYKALIRCKCGLKIWSIKGSFNVKTYIKYLPFRFLAMFSSKEQLVKKYTEIVTKHRGQNTEYFFADGITPGDEKFRVENILEYSDIVFEDDTFMCFKNTDSILTEHYGDYMQLPPEEDRGVNHTIIEIDFGE